MRDKEFFLSRFAELEELAKKVGGSAWQAFGGVACVDMATLSEWRSQTLTLLRQVMPSSAPYTKQLEKFLEDGNKKVLFDRLYGIFKGAYQDFKAGMFDNLKLEIESNVSCDFLGQANALLNDKELVDYSYLPAAVLIGAVLEKTLRSLCENANPKIETVNENGRAKKMSAMIVDLKKAGVINEIRSRQLETWNAIRNSAAHGKIEEFTKEQVAAMLQGVQDFMAQHMK
jgi:hypothetical protein